MTAAAGAAAALPGRTLDRIDAWAARVEGLLGGAACALVLLMVAAICGDVLLRTATRSGLAWANAVAEYSVYALTFLAAPLLLRRGQHIRVDLLLHALPSRLAWALEWAVDAIGAAISALFLFASIRVLLHSHAQASLVIREVVFPEWWLFVPMPLSLALLTLEFGLRMRRLALGRRQMRIEATSAA